VLICVKDKQVAEHLFSEHLKVLSRQRRSLHINQEVRCELYLVLSLSR